jgi:uracil-DNA glycosylase
MILLVGSNPSRLNSDPKVPFKGSKSESTLNSWLKRLKIDSYEVVNVSDVVLNGRPLKVSEWNLKRLRAYCNKASKIIVLGRTAQKAVERVTSKKFAYLAHPSPLNRQINDKEVVDNLLKMCYKYIWSK